MISINNISKSFGNTTVISNLTFALSKSTIVGVIGPSGCGKTTLLNLIANLDQPDSGSISIKGEDRPLSYMMQSASLLPWRTLGENALLGVEVVNGNYHKHITDPVNKYFEAFDLTSFKDHYPDAASAGMRQRVALIRTLLLNSSLLLLDEPFSNLDFDIKLKIQKCLINYQLSNQTTILLVTHDIEDAISLSDTVIVLSNKPTKVKVEIPIELDAPKRDPIEARKDVRFREYFAHIWEELKYLKKDVTS
jgi:NitT/TauT family transport system ATP-binding protein